VRADFEAVPDSELARQSQAGSLLAFEELVYRYEARIYGFLLKSCGNETDARELTQDTFVRAFRAILQFDARREFAPWLFSIARRKLVDRVRTRRIVSEEPIPDSPDFMDPAETLARIEDSENLWATAQRKLPAIQFQALWLRYAEEMDVAQIAKVLRRTNTHVKVLLFRAREVLAKELQGLDNICRSGLNSERGIARSATTLRPVNLTIH
jgi:RNA polymerase sigma-70 factor (ECF subfamily)